ncbi:RHS repeat-associated core domain-containing protein [Delftia tsuruhatensis]
MRFSFTASRRPQGPAGHINHIGHGNLCSRDGLRRPGNRRRHGPSQAIAGFLSIFILVLLVGLGAAFAQPVSAHTYSIYIDTDHDAGTGCSATVVDRHGSARILGAEYLVQVQTLDQAGTRAGPITLSACETGAGTSEFGQASHIDAATTPVKTPTVQGETLEQIELQLPIARLGLGGDALVTLAIGAPGDYLVGAAGQPIQFHVKAHAPASGPVAIPSLGWAAVMVLTALLGTLGWRYRKHAGPPVLLAAVILAGAATTTGPLAWAWSAIAPLAVDPAGDQVAGTPDLRALYASQQGDLLLLRIDAATGNTPGPGGSTVYRDLSPLEQTGELPRFTTAPSLLAQAGQPWSYQVRATDSQGRPLAVEITAPGAPEGMVLSGDVPNQLLHWTPAAQGRHAVQLQVRDGDGRTGIQSFALDVSDDRQLPANPADRASPQAPNLLTPFAESTRFLHEGADPIQQGVAPGALDPVRTAVLRGQVLDRAGSPLAGVLVRVQGQPRFGHTRTRADGWFDMAVNGGGWLTVHYEKPGYLPVQRKLAASVRDWTIAEDVVLTPFDPQYGTIDLSQQRLQAYWGAQTTDERGPRRTTILFPAGTRATAEMPDGSTRALPQLTVRVSEYTVGASGPQAMPGELPSSVGYTWAANFSADEALALGARHVRFDRPVHTYTTNFIGAPVGTAVPAGWYDFERMAWVGSDNGRVVEVLSIEGGKATLRVSRERRAATAQELAELGITDDELQALAQMHAAGAQLWRTPMEHFTPWDCNWPWGPPDDADPPPPSNDPDPDGPDGPADPDDTDNNDPSLDEPGEDVECGCDIYIKQRAVGQRIPLQGAPFDLYYRSDRTLNKRPAASEQTTWRTRVKSPDFTAPPSLRYAEVRSSIAGRRITTRWDGPAFSQAAVLAESGWDGTDAYGRPMPYGTYLQTSVRYAYQAVYYSRPADFRRAFERLAPAGSQIGRESFNAGAAISLSRSRPARLIQPPSRLGVDLSQARIGGWTLKGMRLYDPDRKVLHTSGSEPLASSRMVLALQPRSRTNLPATAVLLRDGRIAVARGHQVLLHAGVDALSRPGEPLAGQAQAGFAGDGGPAREAQFNAPSLVAEAPGGGFYIMDAGNRRLRLVSAQGTVATVAGNGKRQDRFNTGTPYRATDVGWEAQSIAPFADGSLLAVTASRQLVHLTPSGMLTALDLPDPDATPYRVIAASTGDVWIGARERGLQGITSRLYRLDAAGRFTREDHAVSIDRATAGPDGSLLVPEGLNPRIQTVKPFGQRQVLHSPADLAGLGTVHLIGYSGDTGLLLTAASGQLLQLSTGLPAFNGAAAHIVGREDGRTYEEFSPQGLPLSVRSAFTGQVLSTNSYNTSNYLVSVRDAFGNTARLQRDASHRLTQVIGFDGQRTLLAYGADGLLQSVTEPGGATHRMVYNAQGLLSEYHDPRGNADRFRYDAQGRLLSNQAPDGSGWTLSRASDNTITATTAGGHSKTVRQWSLPDNRIEKTSTGLDGLRSVKTGNTRHGDSHTSEANGTRHSIKRRADPVFGAVAAERSVARANGSISTWQSEQRTATWDGQQFSTWSSLQHASGGTAWTQRLLRGTQPTIATTAPDGAQTTVTYNALMQPVAVDTPTQAQLRYGYTARGQLAQVEMQDLGGASRRLGLAYHPHGSPGAGRLATATDALGRESRFSYDAAGRLIASTQPDGRSTRYSHDPSGNLLSLTTPAGTTHSFTYDGAHQRASYLAPQGSIQWNYNLERQPVRVTRPGGETIRFGYDAGARLSSIDSNAGTTTVHYDTVGQLERVSRAGQQIDYRRTHSIVTGESWSGAVNASLETDMDHSARPTRMRIAASHDRIDLPIGPYAGGRPRALAGLRLNYGSEGLITSAIGSHGSMHYGYNGFSEVDRASFVMHARGNSAQARATQLRLAASMRALEGALIAQITDARTCRLRGWLAPGRQLRPSSAPRAVAPGWNDAAANWTVDTPDLDPEQRMDLVAQYGQPLDVDPDYCVEQVRSHLQAPLRNAEEPDSGNWWIQSATQQIRTLRTATAGGAPAVATLGWRPSVSASLTDATSFNTPAISALYDQALQGLQDLETANHQYGMPVEFSYERDPLGRIVRQTERVLATQQEHGYEYDPAGRLIAHTRNGSATRWTYDANGNRTHENGKPIASYDSEDRLLRWNDSTYQYSPAGDLRQKTSPAGTTTYQYDSLGNLRQVQLPGGDRIDYLIDPLNRRIGKHRNGTLQYGLIYQDDLRPVAELKPDGGIRSVFVYADKPNVPSALLRDGKNYHIVSDHLGSVRLVVDPETGDIQQRMDYDAWGRVTHDSNPGFQPFGFAGGLYDPETGLTRFGARDYDAETGRWTAKDPILFGGGDTNLYGYVLQDSVNLIDSDGMLPKPKKPNFTPRGNKKPPPDHRVPNGARERNRGHFQGEEHSLKEKGNRQQRGSRGAGNALPEILEWLVPWWALPEDLACSTLDCHYWDPCTQNWYSKQ